MLYVSLIVCRSLCSRTFEFSLFCVSLGNHRSLFSHLDLHFAFLTRCGIDFSWQLNRIQILLLMWFSIWGFWGFTTNLLGKLVLVRFPTIWRTYRILFTVYSDAMCFLLYSHERCPSTICDVDIPVLSCLRFYSLTLLCQWIFHILCFAFDLACARYLARCGDFVFLLFLCRFIVLPWGCWLILALNSLTMCSFYSPNVFQQLVLLSIHLLFLICMRSLCFLDVLLHLSSAMPFCFCAVSVSIISMLFGRVLITVLCNASMFSCRFCYVSLRTFSACLMP